MKLEKTKRVIMLLYNVGLYEFVVMFQMINEGTSAVLLIASTYEEDSGTFTCKATNSAGQSQVSAKLIVKSKN